MGARTRGLANNVLTSGKLDATDALSGVVAASNIANDSLTSATSFGSVTGGVPAVASDPSPAAEGDIWYNSSTGKLKFVAKVGAWASGGNLNQTRYGLGGAGTQTTALVFAGFPNGPGAQTEQYNGSSWTEVNDLNHGRGYVGGCGTNTAALCFAGNSATIATATLTESYDGSNWTELGDLNTGRYNIAGMGTSTSALATGGYIPSGGQFLAINESWNGSSWTEVGDLNTGRQGLTGAGASNTAAIAIGGGTPSNTGVTESWDGSSWTEVSDLNTARRNHGSVGTSTAAIAFAGQTPPYVTVTELWDGTSWTEVNDMATARGNSGNAGTKTAALTAGGYDGATPFENATEEWTLANTTQVIG